MACAKENDLALRRLLGYERFSKRSKAHLPLTKHPNSLPTSNCCPGQPRAWFSESISSQHARFAFGNGCDCPSYVRDRILRPASLVNLIWGGFGHAAELYLPLIPSTTWWSTLGWMVAAYVFRGRLEAERLNGSCTAWTLKAIDQASESGCP
jgi:hypothetical protein